MKVNVLVSILALGLSLGATALLGYILYRVHRMREHLTLRKLILVDEHGIPRLVLAAGKDLPGPVIRGTFYPAAMRGSGGENTLAGMIFLNEEGTEQGGILWGGRRTSEGWYQMWRLSLDPYLQNEVLVMHVAEENGERSVRLELVDRPVDPEGFETIIRRYASAFQGEQVDSAGLEKIREEIVRYIQEQYGNRWEVPRLKAAWTRDGLVFSLRDTTGGEWLHLRLSDRTLSGYAVTPEGEKVPLHWTAKR